jgi:transposase
MEVDLKGLGFREGKKEKVGIKSDPLWIEGEGNFGLKEEGMITEDDFGAIQALKRQGMKKKKVARILGLDRKTVSKYWKLDRCPKAEQAKKASLLDRFHGHLLKRLPETDYCAAVCLLELRRMGYTGGYTILKDFVRPLREERRRFEDATMRFETGPGKQAQVDWGSTVIELGGEAVRIHLFVMVLGYSRRIYVRAELGENLAALIDCHNRAFEWFGGLTQTILYDNPKTICLKRDFEGKDITWNPQFLDFSRYQGFEARLCKPYRARTKGKVESGVKYVKHNFFALYGRVFESLEELNQKLQRWAVEVADERIHGTTHEKPSLRFKDESLISMEGKAPYRIEIPITRIIPDDARVVFKTNRYSVPWAHVGKEALLQESGERLRIYVQGTLAAEHPLLGGCYQQSIMAGHYDGILKHKAKVEKKMFVKVSLWEDASQNVQERDLAGYEVFALSATEPSASAEALVAGGVS